MNRDRLAFFILALALICGIALRVVALAGKRNLEHDEGISFLAATGHQGEFAGIDNNAPYGRWVKAQEWQRFLKVDDLFCFGRIRSDLARYDIHPPLYFWVLHIWSIIFGVHLWTGPLLNILLFLITALLLFRFARHVLRDIMESSVVVFIWAVSPAVICVSFITRQYDLLALCVVVLISQVFRFLSREERVSVGGLRAHAKITSHFGRRCIPPVSVAKPRNMFIFLCFRALTAGRRNTQICEVISARTLSPVSLYQIKPSFFRVPSFPSTFPLLP